jgi:uncharacterized lipoprotein
MRIAGFVLLSFVALGLAGCKTPLESCSQTNKDYAGAQELPPLKAPPGLDPPDTRNALKVPPIQAPERVRGKNEPCLDTPPPFTTPKATEPQKPS